MRIKNKITLKRWLGKGWMGEYQSQLITDPTFELDKDLYPTEETLDTIRYWPYEGDWDVLLKHVCFLFAEMPGSYRVSRYPIPDSLATFDHPVKHIEYVLTTVGWSGCENIISALQDNYMFFGNCWHLSKRGGYHVFHVEV